MGAAVSSNFSEQAQSASTSFSTEIKQESKAAQSAQNTASQECKDMKIIAKGDGTVVEACNNKISQGITAKQLQETIQDAQIQNESYQSLQQKMSQAAKSVVKGFNFGAYAEAKNTVKQSMNASATISNDISQECGAASQGVNEAFQKCEKSEITATDGAEVRMCNMEVEQQAGDRYQMQGHQCYAERGPPHRSPHRYQEGQAERASTWTRPMASTRSLPSAIRRLRAVGSVFACHFWHLRRPYAKHLEM